MWIDRSRLNSELIKPAHLNSYISQCCTFVIIHGLSWSCLLLLIFVPDISHHNVCAGSTVYVDVVSMNVYVSHLPAQHCWLCLGTCIVTCKSLWCSVISVTCHTTVH